MNVIVQKTKNIFSNGYDIAFHLQTMEIIILLLDKPQRVLSTNVDMTLAKVE